MKLRIVQSNSEIGHSVATDRDSPSERDYEKFKSSELFKTLLLPYM